MIMTEEKPQNTQISTFLASPGVHVFIGNVHYKSTDLQLSTFLKDVTGLSVKSVLLPKRFGRAGGYAFATFEKGNVGDIIEKVGGKEYEGRVLSCKAGVLKGEEELKKEREEKRERREKVRGERKVREARSEVKVKEVKVEEDKKEGDKKEEDKKEKKERKPRERKERQPREKRERKESEDTLYVGNLPYQMTREDLESIFGEYGVKECEIVMNGERSKGFGFVQMKGKEGVDRVLEELKDVAVEGRVLVIKRKME